MIYFDSGATTLEKPRTVRQAMARAVNTMSSPGRGSHQATQLAEETDYACRAAAAKLFGVADESNVIFTGNATHGLNIAIHTLVQPGSRVVISGYEHNAVTRPLHAIPNVTLTVLDTPPFQPERMVEELKAALAQGAVIPPNRQFLAMLGDQTTGTNVEAPLATIKQAMAETLAGWQGSADGQPINIYIGEELLDSVIANSQNRRALRSGGR